MSWLRFLKPIRFLVVVTSSVFVLPQVEPWIYIRYIAGAVLMVFGVPFAVYSYIVLLDVTFTGLGFASVVLGLHLSCSGGHDPRHG